MKINFKNIGIILLLAGAVLGTGLAIRIKFNLVAPHYDERFVDGKFYRRPIHPGFISQRHPNLSVRVVKSSGPLEGGLPTAKEFEKSNDL
ncbi:MAG: hypothetical protein ACP5G4_02755 [bacterium]